MTSTTTGAIQRAETLAAAPAGGGRGPAPPPPRAALASGCGHDTHLDVPHRQIS